MTQPLKRLVIHCTATPEGRDVRAADIIRWHTSPPPRGNGWDRPGYTDLITLEGKVERLHPTRDLDTLLPDETTYGCRGYNATSRHIAYVGGVAADGLTPKDTRTPQQREALARYVADFRRRHPGAEVVGHHDLNPAKACPSFDVSKEF